MSAWYNEPDPYAAAWLRNLIAAGLIAPGVVDERKIQDVEAWELFGYTQCHFFAGIGVWSGALRAAGWPDDKPIWTGSCPCQPFSNAGKRKGTDDERHLWPTWFKLIEVCKPAIVVGEQVSGGIAVGKWSGDEVQSLWERKATLGILQDGIEREIKASLQDLSKFGSTRLVQGTQTQHSRPSQSFGGSGESKISSEISAVRSDSGMVASQAGRQGLRSDGYSVQFQREAELEHSFTGSQNPRERIHTSEYAGGPIRLEHWLRQLGRTEIDRNRLKSFEQAARKIRNAAKRIDRKIESESRSWIAALQSDMEGAGYAIGASDLCAAGFGQAHLRQRLYFVGLANSEHDGRRCDQSGRGEDRGIAVGRRSEDGGLADALHAGRPERRTIAGSRQVAGIGAVGGLADDDDTGREGRAGMSECADQCAVGSSSLVSGLANSDLSSQHERASGRKQSLRDECNEGSAGTVLHSREAGSLDDADWLLCRNPAGEPSWRPVESRTFPLAHGITDRMGKLRAYGNALDFKTAQGFCEVVAEIVGV